MHSGHDLFLNADSLILSENLICIPSFPAFSILAADFLPCDCTFVRFLLFLQIWSFKMVTPCCANNLEIHTDPKTCEYIVVRDQTKTNTITLSTNFVRSSSCVPEVEHHEVGSTHTHTHVRLIHIHACAFTVSSASMMSTTPQWRVTQCGVRLGNRTTSRFAEGLARTGAPSPLEDKELCMSG